MFEKVVPEFELGFLLFGTRILLYYLAGFEGVLAGGGDYLLFRGLIFVDNGCLVFLTGIFVLLCENLVALDVARRVFGGCGDGEGILAEEQHGQVEGECFPE